MGLVNCWQQATGVEVTGNSDGDEDKDNKDEEDKSNKNKDKCNEDNGKNEDKIDVVHSLRISISFARMR